MKPNTLIITTSNFESLIASLLSNLKLGYGKCSEIEFVNGFFRAVLEHGKDDAYISRLLGSTVTSDKENTLDLMDYLSNASTPVREGFTAYVNGVPIEAMEEPPVDMVTEPVKIKRTRRKTTKETK